MATKQDIALVKQDLVDLEKRLNSKIYTMESRINKRLDGVDEQLVNIQDTLKHLVNGAKPA